MLSFSDKIKLAIMGLLLIILFHLLYFCVLSDKKQKMNMESSSIFYDIYPRNNDFDNWTLKVPRHPLMRGVIYESKIFNRSNYNITDWKIVLNIKEKCYLNSCWNGKVWIRQKKDGKTMIQEPIRLKDYEAESLTVQNYHSPVNPTLIYLNPGDQVIYYPDDDYSERFLPAYNEYDGYQSTTIGFIIYKEEKKGNIDFDFATSYIVYHMQGGLWENPMVYVISALFILWIFFMTIQIRIMYLKFSKAKDRERDRQTVEQIMTVFTKFIEAKDLYTGSHSERVAACARMIAKEAGKDDAYCQKIFYCGLLHDCGKISVRDTILKKKSAHTDEEFKIVRSHTKKGYELLKSLSSIPEACETALYHHERYDGTGYPEHLSGNYIPEAARIIAVADAYDSMSSAAGANGSLPREKILKEIKENSGTQFDPQFVDSFFRLIEKNMI